MIKYLMIPLILFIAFTSVAQTATPAPPTPTPTPLDALFPVLQSPTPWLSPTPPPTVEMYMDDASELLVTAQADPVNYDSDGEQILIDGLPVLPGFNSQDSQTLFGYMKWLTTPAAGSVFGPFATLLIPLGVMITIAFVRLVVFFWENVAVSIFKSVLWLIERAIQLLPF
jgi:hypothetical protein